MSKAAPRGQVSGSQRGDAAPFTFGRPLDAACQPPTGLLLLLGANGFALGLNDAFLNPILPDVARGLGVSIALAGQLATTTLLVGAVTTLLLGVLSDFYGRRPFLLGGLAIAGVANLALALAPSFAWALAGRVLAGFGLVFALNLALVGDWYVDAARDRVTARVLGANALGWVIGVPGIAAVAGLVGWRTGVAALGAVFLLVAALGIAALPDRPRAATRVGTRWTVSAIWASHRQRPELWRALLTAAIRGASWTAFLTFAGGWLQNSFELATWQLGPVFTASALAYMAGIEVGSRWAVRTSSRTVITLATLGTGLLVLVLPVAPWLAVALAGFVVAALLCGAAGSTLLALILQLAPESRGATMALANSLTGVGGAIGVILAGLAIAVLGYPGLGLVTGALAASGAVLFRFSPESA